MMNAVLAKTQIGVEERLDLVFDDRPEPDYVHGEVVERAMPTLVHAQIQALLVLLFARLLPKVHLTLRLPEFDFEISAQELFKDI